VIHYVDRDGRRCHSEYVGPNGFNFANAIWREHARLVRQTYRLFRLEGLAPVPARRCLMAVMATWNAR